MSALRTIVQLLSIVVLASFNTFASAQAPSYGPDVNLATAKKIAAGAIAEAQKNKWDVAVAIVDNHGFLVYYERMDDTQTASPLIAVEKARTAAMFRRPTRVIEDVINKGRTSFLGLPGATPVDGGLPIMSGGKVIGGIGVSGVASQEDGQIAKAGLEALK